MNQNFSVKLSSRIFMRSRLYKPVMWARQLERLALSKCMYFDVSSIEVCSGPRLKGPKDIKPGDLIFAKKTGGLKIDWGPCRSHSRFKIIPLCSAAGGGMSSLDYSGRN